MRPVRKFFAAIGVILFVGLAVLEYLNFTGYCYAQRRYVPDDELIEIAANRNLRFSNEQPGNIHYTSVKDLRDQNPNCCAVNRKDAGPFAPSTDNWLQVFGLKTIAVEIWYRLKDAPPKNYIDYVVAMNACGKVGERFGIYETSARK